MKRRIWLGLLLVLSMGSNCVVAQAVELKGQYTFEKKNGMSSMFVFEDDSASFIAFRASDIASIYGEGKFELKGDMLILHYDSAGVRKRVSKSHLVTPTGTDTLTVRNMTPKKFELVLQPSGYVETYRKVSDAVRKKR
jgi:hypothetical protein